MDVKKVVIVMPYHERQYQLDKTLETIGKSWYKNFSVIIMDDGSREKVVLPTLSYDARVIRLKDKIWTNCAPVYNYGFIEAIKEGADIIIIQSAECYHVGDVISYAGENCKKDNYIAFGCFRLDKETTFKEHNIDKLSKENNFMVNSDNGGNGQNAWWNHPVYSRLPQYWGAAITAENLRKINGIDERFAYGYAFEDGCFLKQIENLGLRIDITDYPYVVHQWHGLDEGRQAVMSVPALYNRNRKLYLELIESDIIRAEHCITPDL